MKFDLDDYVSQPDEAITPEREKQVQLFDLARAAIYFSALIWLLHYCGK